MNPLGRGAPSRGRRSAPVLPRKGPVLLGPLPQGPHQALEGPHLPPELPRPPPEGPFGGEEGVRGRPPPGKARKRSEPSTRSQKGPTASHKRQFIWGRGPEEDGRARPGLGFRRRTRRATGSLYQALCGTSELAYLRSPPGAFIRIGAFLGMERDRPWPWVAQYGGFRRGLWVVSRFLCKRLCTGGISLLKHLLQRLPRIREPLEPQDVRFAKQPLRPPPFLPLRLQVKELIHRFFLGKLMVPHLRPPP